MIDVVRGHLLALAEDTYELTLWITMLQPRRSHGNDFNAEVQTSIYDFVDNVRVRPPPYARVISFKHSERQR